ncbi:MAG: PspC domain-containing protein [Chloroflexota bacterium]|nr:PspC domain-containing protein [Chloroflexota bacterium]
MRQLKRARHDRRLLGVCGGIAHTYGLDPTLDFAS